MSVDTENYPNVSFDGLDETNCIGVEFLIASAGYLKQLEG